MDANIYLCSDYYSGAFLVTSAHSCLCTGLAFYSTGYTSLPLGLQYQCSLQGPDALQQPSPSLHLRREMEASAQTSVDSCQQTGEMNFHDDSKFLPSQSLYYYECSSTSNHANGNKQVIFFPV